MADISKLARVIAGAAKNVDLSSNTLVVGSIKIGANELSEAIAGRLLALQDGSDVDATYHTHDGRYFTETELGSTSGPSGASRIGVANTPSNYTPGSADVEAHLVAIDSALASAGGSDFSDALFRISDDGDSSKKIAFQASGISASTVRTITMPDADVDLGKVATALQRDGSVAATANLPMGGFKLTGLAAGSTAGDSVRYEQAILASGVNAFAADQSMGGFKLTNLADPVSGQDAVTMAWALARIAGIKPKAAVRVATTTAGTLASSFENGDSVDGVTLATGDRILIKDQAAPEENGIYVVNASGAPTRATDFDSLSPVDEINGAWVSVQLGTANAGKIYVQFGVVATIGTDAINFEYFNPIAGLIGGDMITFAGSTFSVDLATVSGLESSNPGNVAGQLRVKLEASNPSLQIDGSNQLGVKFNAAGAIASGASGVAVQVDNTTIEINSNALRVKANSIGPSHLTTAVADQSTITGGNGSALAVQNAPLVTRVMVAGESFAADTSFFVRMALTGETAGRVYKADKDASSSNKYMAIGIAKSVAGVSAGGNIQVTMLGEHSLGANDSAFASGDVGKELFVGTAGAIILGASLADTTNEAAFCAGVVQTTAKIWVDFKQLRGIA